MDNKKNKIVILDLDGVLIDSLPNMRISWNMVKKKFNLKSSFNDYKKFIGLPFYDILKKLNIKDNYKNIRSSYYKFSNQNMHKLIVKKKTINNLKLLKKRFFLALFTSKDKTRTKKILPKLKIKFDIVIAQEDVKFGKPNKEGIILFLNKFKIKKKNAVFVGDSKFDYLSSKNAKVKYYHAKWGFELNTMKANTIKNLSDLLR